MPYCGNCGKPIAEIKGTCQHCGNEMCDENKKLPKVYYKTLPLTERKCCSCGATIPVSSQFCGECGTKNEKQTERKLPYCVLCDELLPESANYCRLCGIQYTEAEDGYVEILSQPVCIGCGEPLKASAFCENCGTPAPSSRSLRLKRTVPSCRHCGKPINTDAIFCENCGKQISVTVKLRDRAVSTSGVYYSPIVEGDTIRCPGCGYGGMQKDRKVCWNCGIKFTKIDD